MSVIELDGDGSVLAPELTELSQLYPSDLILGVAPESMLDQHIAAFVPNLSQRPLSDLFKANPFGTPSLITSQQSKRTGSIKRSAMKSYNSGKAALSICSLAYDHWSLCVWQSQLL
jgi:hypothetical protein